MALAEIRANDFLCRLQLEANNNVTVTWLGDA